MQVLSVNLRAQAETLSWQNQTVETGINKLPVSGPIHVNLLGLEGDQIMDKKHHGGTYKAVYSYATEDYDYWRTALERPDIPFGALGENLTTQGLDEANVCIGDQFQIGSVILEATEPRQPCRVLNMNFQEATLVKQFLAAGRMGIYFKVIQPGSLQAGDTICALKQAAMRVPLSEITRLHKREKEDTAGLERILHVPELPPEWREIFKTQLKKIQP